MRNEDDIGHQAYLSLSVSMALTFPDKLKLSTLGARILRLSGLARHAFKVGDS